MSVIEKLKRSLIESNKQVKTKSDPIEIRQANAGLSRIPITEYLQYADFSDGFMINLVGDQIRIGFGVSVGAYSLINDKVAITLEQVYKALPEGSVVQNCEHSTDNVKPELDLWRHWQNKYCQDPMIEKMTKYRFDMLLNATFKPIHTRSGQCLRSINRFSFFTIPYTGLPGNERDFNNFFEKCKKDRSTVVATLSKASLSPKLMERTEILETLRRLVNPHVGSIELEQSNALTSDASLAPGERLSDYVAQRNTSIEVLSDGGILFSSGSGDDVVATHMTIDKYPDETHLYDFGQLTGNMLDRDQRINMPYFLYTTVHICNKDTAKEEVEISMSWLGKQAQEGSEFLKNTMPHMYERFRNCKEFIADINNNIPVQMYTGIVLYTKPEETSIQVETVKTHWSDKGFKISPERHISFPIWLASLPFQYQPEWDKPRQGLARAKLAKSINAASVQPIVGDWKGMLPMMKEDAEGNPFPYCNGVPLVTGRGEVSFFDPFVSETNYNFVVLATSGAGKSFFANDLVRDIRSRGGLAYVFDMGRSYKDACELMSGSNLDFKVNEPISINHFWGIQTLEEFDEMKDLFAESLITMMFPEERPTNLQVHSIKRGLHESWQFFGEKLGLREIQHWFQEGCAKRLSGDAEYQIDKTPDYSVPVDKGGPVVHEADKDYQRTLNELSAYLYTYAIGSESIWFNGEPQVDLDNPFTILELNDLENSPSLKSIVFTTIIMLVTRKIYSYSRDVPKLMLIDEAWNLLADDRAGPFIEKAFRTIRKFFGAAGIISQSCKDVYISKASEAAWSNSAWKIFLMQRPDSVEFAREKKMFSNSTDQVCDVMDTLRRMDNFSEVMVEYGGYYSPYRFFVDGFSAYCYSSKAQDNAYLEKIMDEKSITKEEAIEYAAGFRK